MYETLLGTRPNGATFESMDKWATEHYPSYQGYHIKTIGQPPYAATLGCFRFENQLDFHGFLTMFGPGAL